MLNIIRFIKNHFFTIPAIVIITLSGVYIANCFTPLRLGNDVLRYFQIKEALEGVSVSENITGNSLPNGYPLLLLMLSWFNMCTSFFIVLANCFYLAGSLYFICHLFKGQFRYWHLISLTLLNWIIIKTTITPLSDIQYMFFSTGTLFFFIEYSKKRKALLLIGMLVFCFLAILTRAIGVLLPASMGLSFILSKKGAISERLRSSSIWIIFTIAVFLLMIIIFSRFFRVDDYIELMLPFFRSNPTLFFIENIRIHLTDWAEIFINTSFLKLPLISAAIKEPFALLAGILFMGYFLWLLLKLTTAIPVVIIIYLISYIILIFNWPTYDARFWVPVLPLIISIILQMPVLKKQYLSAIIFMWKLVYIVFGTIALGYYTLLTFNKEMFAERHDMGIWRNEYRVYFFEKPLTDSNVIIREYPLKILKKYDR